MNVDIDRWATLNDYIDHSLFAVRFAVQPLGLPWCIEDRVLHAALVGTPFAFNI